MKKSLIYPEKNKGFKTKLSFKIHFWATVMEKECSGRDTSKGKRESQVYIHI